MALQAPDPAQLAHVREHALAQIHAASNYICLETIERWHRRRPREKFTLLDVLRLEVTVAGNKEVFSWPDGKVFEDYDPTRYIAGGMLATGEFAADLRSIFLNRDVALQPVAADSHSGTLDFRYTIPVFATGFVVSNGSAHATVGTSGIVRLDPHTLDIVELEAKAQDIPVALGINSVSTRVVYTSIRLGDTVLILPSAAETAMTLFTGEEKRNVVAFSHWRQFTAESQLRFDTEGGATSTAPPPPKPRKALPADLTIVSRLRTAIDTDKAAVGDVVEAEVEKDVTDNKEIVIPRGTILTGRIRRLERQQSRVPYLVLAVELSTAGINGVPVPVYATLKDVELRKGMSRKPPGSRTRQTSTELLGQGRLEQFEVDEYIDRSLLNIASFYIQGNVPRIEPGLKFTWVTQSPRDVPKPKSPAGLPPPDPSVFAKPTPY